MDESPPPEWLPMFPLGRGIFPGSRLTLQVFEPRYLEMIDLCTRRGIGFGVVLIERGQEVGGGDERFDVGVAAAIAEIGAMEDRLMVTVRGEGRIRVAEWLDDDPFPQARVERLADPPGFAPGERARLRLGRAFTRGLAMLSELGVGTGAVGPLPEDALAAAYAAVDVLPVPDLDRQRVLEADDPAERIERSTAAVEAFNQLIEARLGGR